MNPADPTLTHAPQETADPSDAAWDAGLAAAFGPADTGSHHPTADPEAGTVLAGKYRLSERIGQGGMGSVWVAHQSEPVKRKVAVKLIKAGMDSKSVLARFEAERQALAVMDHPNIAKVLDGGLHDGKPFFVMELVKGVPITEYCDAHKLTPQQRLELFVPVCQAIQHAHQKGIIHRDIKPSNVLVALYDDKPVPKVIDFGVAKATGGVLTEQTIETAFGGVVGTPQYMSPEQASLNNLDIDTRSDVYSLGVLLYELLVGSPPFARKELQKAGLLEILRVVREEEPPRPSDKLSTADALPSLSASRGTEPKKLTGLLRNELDWIVMKALEKDRGRRYETANGFAADVNRFLSGEPVQAHPPSTAYRLKKFVRRHRGQVFAAGLVLLTLLAGVIGTSVGMVRAENRRIEAEQAKADEADRAEGERLANLVAQQKKAEAEAAAAAEKAARLQAQKRLAQIEKGNEILTSIFKDLDLRRVRAGIEQLEAVLAKRLVKAAEQLEGEAVGDPLVMAGLQDRLGLSLLHLGYPRDAIPLFLKARESRTTGLGADHRDTLTSMGNLATGYLAAGKLDLALPLHEETLKLMRAGLGADHRDTLTSMNNLATTYRVVGKLNLALPLLEETLKLRKAKLGTDSQETLTSMNNLATAYQAAGKWDLALPLLEETLSLMKVNLGIDHLDTLTCMNNVATGYLKAGKFDLALPLFEETLRLTKAKVGIDNPDTLANMTSLATAYLTAGKLDPARSLYEETLKLMRKKQGADHPDTLTNIYGLALVYRALSKLDSALPLYQEAALGVEKRRFEHEYAGLIVPHAIAALEEAEQFDRAATWRRKWLAVVKERSGADSPPCANELAGLGSNLIRQQKWTEAEPVLREALTVREKKEPNDWRTSNTRSLLGAALLGQKKYADAEPLLVKAYEGMKAREKTIPQSGGGELRIPQSLDRLIDLYTTTDKPDEAKRYKELRAKYPPAKPLEPKK